MVFTVGYDHYILRGLTVLNLTIILTRNSKYKLVFGLLAIILCVWYYLCLPDCLFTDSYSTVVNDRSGMLLGAKIAKDGQWRFPASSSVPNQFASAVIAFEDKRFYDHCGVDFRAIGRAIIQNVKAGEIESGASTITMQVIRLSRKGKARTIYQKVIEMILATRLELRHTKDEILAMYASHAPYGGNVVGLDAACWRYYHKSAANLSMSEAAMLAVLPNAPSLIHLSRSRGQLISKRDRLLMRLRDMKVISEEDYQLSLLEVIPPRPFALPVLAPHLVEYLDIAYEGQLIQSTIDREMQHMISEIADRHCAFNQQSDIHNIGVLVVDNETAEVLSYIGNASNAMSERAVDMIQARRSSGSILKPLLYAHMLEEGSLLPKALIKDVPMQFSGFSPRNYNKKYSGATPADQALAMSLNIPAVYCLQQFGVAKFLDVARSHGITTLRQNEDHYGLSLILGGGEVTLWELCMVYANMASVLRKTARGDNVELGRKLKLRMTDVGDSRAKGKGHILSPGAIYKTFQALITLLRPGQDGGWQQYDSSKPIAWKTGTSYGHRDAWAMGVSSRYTIGVWVGNADGEPKHGLIGVTRAGQVLFDIVGRMDVGPFFDEPIDDLPAITTCQQSGYLAGPFCSDRDTIFAPAFGARSAVCPYHSMIHLDKDGLQVNSDCHEISEMEHVTWFELPPAMAHYYHKLHPEYTHAPRFRADCSATAGGGAISFIYPSARAQIYLPTNGLGVVEDAVFSAAHSDPTAELHWHIDDEYLGSTVELHNMKISATPGLHTVTVVDLFGNEVAQYFEIM